MATYKMCLCVCLFAYLPYTSLVRNLVYALLGVRFIKDISADQLLTATILILLK